MRKFKKILVVILCFCLLTSTIPALSTNLIAKADNTKDGFTYRVVKGDAIITKVDRNLSGEIEIPYSLNSCKIVGIDDNAFSNCPYITSIKVVSTNKVFSSVDGVLFNKDKTKLLVYPGGKEGEYTVPDGVKDIANTAFYNTNIDSISFPNGLTTIGDYAFYNCNDLQSVQIPDSVTSLGKFAFADCFSLNSVKLSAGLTDIPQSAFESTTIDNIEIPNGVKNIKSKAFNTSPVDTLKISESVESIDKYAFSGTTINDIIVSPNNSNYTEADGVLLSKDKTTVIKCSALKVGEYTIPNTVTEIYPEAFLACTFITRVNIPSTVTKIPERAFVNCTSLESVLFEYGVENIGNAAFSRCTKLKVVNLPDSVVELGEDVFSSCEQLTGVRLGKGLKTIPGYAFYGCGFVSFNIPDNITLIEFRAFDNCASLENITIGTGVKQIDIYAFMGCSSLNKVYYKGSEEEKAKILIISGNSLLTNSQWYYNSCIGSAEHSYNIGNICTVCSEASSHIHDFKWVIDKMPTCVAGVMHEVCELCGTKRNEGTAISPTQNHVYTDKFDTDCDNGCGYIRKAPGHTYGKNYVSAVATFSANGTISKKSLSDESVVVKVATIYRIKTVALEKTSVTYTGKTIKPKVVVKDSNGNTISSDYYTVKYSNNQKVGKATAKITFKGNYKGEKTLTFKINPKATKISSLKSGKKAFTVKYKKQTSGSGYEIQYSTSKSFKGAKTVKIAKNKTVSKTVKSLKSKKTYYVRVRTVKGSYKSSWSAAKKVKTK